MWWSLNSKIKISPYQPLNSSSLLISIELMFGVKLFASLNNNIKLFLLEIVVKFFVWSSCQLFIFNFIFITLGHHLWNYSSFCTRRRRILIILLVNLITIWDFLFNNNYKSTNFLFLQFFYNCKSICEAINIGTPWSCNGMEILKHAKECNGMKILTQAKECNGMRTRITLG